MISKNPQRVAWITVFSGFILFCILCAGSTWFIRWFIFESPADLRLHVYVARGTLSISAQDNLESRSTSSNTTVQSGERIRTDTLSQGHLTIQDPFDEKLILATVQMMPDSELTIQKATRPRFNLGNQPFTIQLGRAKGNFNIHVSPEPQRPILLEVMGDSQSIRLEHAGYYIVHVNGQGLTVTVRQGQAILVAGNGQTRLVKRDQTGELHFIRRDRQRLEAAFNLTTAANFDVIPNSLFASSADPDAPEQPALSANAYLWGCFPSKPELDDQPRGNSERLFFQDRYAIHFERTGQGSSEVGCNASLFAPEHVDDTPPDVLDVSGYNSLRVRATLYLESHSLEGCGTLGTECALMIKITYRNQNQVATGGTSEWLQGFYIHNLNGLGRTRCDSCFQEHIQVNGQAWYTFESGDLVRDLPIEQQNLRPAEILAVRVYSSGHSYEAYISELALVGQVIEEPTP
jgi:hypothetical protein